MQALLPYWSVASVVAKEVILGPAEFVTGGTTVDLPVQGNLQLPELPCEC
jgi:hypothetical protein